MHVLLAAGGLGVEHVDELGKMLVVFGHLRGEDHVDHVVPHRLVRVPVEILEYVHAVVICESKHILNIYMHCLALCLELLLLPETDYSTAVLKKGAN